MYVPPPGAGSYVRKTPQEAGWTTAKQRKSPGLFSLWSWREAGRAGGWCPVCNTPWDQPERVGCGGCRDLSAWWPRPGVTDADTWHRRYGYPPVEGAA